MNATQKDFFSFQWQQALSHANALLDGSEDPAILDNAGNAGFDLQAVAPESMPWIQPWQSCATRCH